MRIGLTSIVFNKQGGISRYVAELAERFVREHEVHLLTSRYETRVDGLIVHRSNILWNPISLQVVSNALETTLQIKKLREAGIDVVNSQGAEAINSDIVTMQSCQKAAVRKFSAERGLSYAIMKSVEPRNNIVLAIERYNLKHCKRMIAISNSVKDEIIENYWVPEEKIDVIHSGVNLLEFNPENKKKYRRDIRQKHSLDETDTVLMFAGWEFKRKGLQYVIEALPSLSSSIKVLAVGGADRKPYENLAGKLGVKGRVVFAGHQRNISEYYAASDIFVFPTAYEPFGLVITEAMASGVPVVTTKTAGAAELITDGNDGMLLNNPYDSREISDKVKYILENNLLGSMGLKARRTAEKYSWDKVVTDTLAVYESL